MGNTVASLNCATGGMVVRKVRVLLPDGILVLLDGPVDVVELMIEHPNHMVVHCATDGRTERAPSMTILHPDQELQPGEAYIIHPIPLQYAKTLSKPQNLQVSKRSMALLSGEKQQQKPPKQRSLRRVSALRLDSLSEEEEEGHESLKTSLLESDGKGLLGAGFSDEMDADVHINVYMGWRPALESIPELPVGGYQETAIEQPMLITTRPLAIAAQ